MKLNWGTGIAIFLALFCGSILTFVIRVSIEDKFDHELVTQDYYEKELNFSREAIKVNKAKALQKNLEVKADSQGLHIHFPDDIDTDRMKGSIYMYRPSKAALDFEREVALDQDNNFLIPKSDLVDGKWKLKVSWTIDNTEYIYKKDLML